MRDCGRMGTAILEVVRGTASEATRLLLDEHLAACGRCREERAHWSLLEGLRDVPVPHLGPEARTRILRRLVATQKTAALWTPPSWSGWRAWAAAGAAALVLVGSWRLTRQALRPLQHGSAIGVSRSPTDAVGSTGAEAPWTLFQGDGPGELSVLSGVKIAYEAGTSLRIPRSSQGRVVELLSGRVDVDVTPGNPGERGGARFEVRTGSFLVEVLGTRFIVTPDEVHTLRGVVRVRDLAGHELAVLPAGKIWERPATPAAEASAPQATSRASAPAPNAKAHVKSATQLLAEARTLLGAGEARRARELLTQVPRRGGGHRQLAMAALLTGDSYLIEGRRDLALPLYRRTAAQHRGTAEGETAAFAAAEILVEQGARGEARRALVDYLSRYPTGHFAREAQERLTALGTP